MPLSMLGSYTALSWRRALQTLLLCWYFLAQRQQNFAGAGRLLARKI